jgi:hypothetical protein
VAKKKRTYLLRARFSDGIERAALAIWIGLSRRQGEVLERRAAAAGQTVQQYLRDRLEADINRMVAP